MKTITIILATLLILQINSLFANNDGVPVRTNKETNLSTILVLAPSTPKEATFEDMIPATEIFVLAPITPKEATFEDIAEDFIFTRLAPLTPAEADFNDDEHALDTTTISLLPTAPSKADFSELP